MCAPALVINRIFISGASDWRSVILLRPANRRERRVSGKQSLLACLVWMSLCGSASLWRGDTPLTSPVASHTQPDLLCGSRGHRGTGCPWPAELLRAARCCWPWLQLGTANPAALDEQGQGGEAVTRWQRPRKCALRSLPENLGLAQEAERRKTRSQTVSTPCRASIHSSRRGNLQGQETEPPHTERKAVYLHTGLS